MTKLTHAFMSRVACIKHSPNPMIRPCDIVVGMQSFALLV